jgi:hypothetical protein
MDESVAPVECNYRDKAELSRIGYNVTGEAPGVSVFLCDGDGVLHAYSAYACGTDLLTGTSNYLDLAPLGRQEYWEEPAGAPTPRPAAGGGCTTSTDRRSLSIAERRACRRERSLE